MSNRDGKRRFTARTQYAVPKRVQSFGVSRKGDKALYFFGVANNVHHEYLKKPAPGTYRVELANADGQTVTVRNHLKPRANGQTKIVVDVPARLIQTGDYQIKLARHTDGQLESVGRYYFRALAE